MAHRYRYPAVRTPTRHCRRVATTTGRSRSRSRSRRVTRTGPVIRFWISRERAGATGGKPPSRERLHGCSLTRVEDPGRPQRRRTSRPDSDAQPRATQGAASCARLPPSSRDVAPLATWRDITAWMRWGCPHLEDGGVQDGAPRTGLDEVTKDAANRVRVAECVGRGWRQGAGPSCRVCRVAGQPGSRAARHLRWPKATRSRFFSRRRMPRAPPDSHSRHGNPVYACCERMAEICGARRGLYW